MNGTIIDIHGISVDVIPIDLEYSTDKSHLIVIKDNKKELLIHVSYGQITHIDEKIRSGFDQQ